MRDSEKQRNIALALGIGSMATGYFSSQIKSLSYETKARTSELQGKQAKLEANYRGMKMKQSYNDIMASNAVMAASSGRSASSATVQNLNRANQERLNWDLDYNEISGALSQMSKEIEASSYRGAAKTAEKMGKAEALGQGLLMYSKYSQIK
jgi:cystathionine beta-lyase/cystathionine gamma-synthase